MDWQALKKELWESVTFSSVTKAMWGGAGTLIAIYGKTKGKELIKKTKSFFHTGGDILSLQDNIKQNSKKIADLENDIYIANAKQMALVYCAPDAVFVNNNKGEVIFVNPAWLDLTGMPTAKDAYVYGYMRVIHKENIDWVKENNKSLAEHPSSFDNYIIFQHYKTRAKITTLCRSEPIFDNKGVVQETIGRLTVISIEDYVK